MKKTFIKDGILFTLEDKKYRVGNLKVYTTIEELQKHSPAELLKAYNYNLNKQVHNRFCNDTRIKELFQSIFNTPLDRFRDTFISAITGSFSFNIVTFDDFLNTPKILAQKN